MTKEDIKSAIQNFSQGNLTENALNLFKTLGYNTERQAPLDRPDYAAFKDSFMDGQSRFNEDKALVKEWSYVDLLFQLSKEEMVMKNKVETQNLASLRTPINNTVIESYLFFAIELNDSVETQDFASLQRRRHYSRTELSNITREINRLFPMPVMLLFRHGETLTLSVINRRLHKRDEGRDVLEKVTLIKDIRIDNPHRAHIEILFDLASDELLRKHRFTNFVELHNAWQKTLDTKELNKRFFQELANWYFWAVQNVEFPDDAEKKKDVRNATNVIRLITRLMFVWFLKEKGLVSEKLFDEKRLKEILVGGNTGKGEGDHKGAPLPNHSIYYKAILQNLFFATLNTEMDKRRFRSKNDSGRDGHFFIHNVFRYEKEFIDPKETLERYFAHIPFLNGGLFECLDKEVEEGGKLKRIRIDGFSDRDDNSLKVPDELFFGAEKETDLNDTYGTKNKHYKVRGLIDILSSYKFTIAENTPIEEEVALDPELLGKVFENLLANFNPETQTTARKQTGSFYTPREIVNYMVDESLIAYLSTAIASNETASGHGSTSSPRPVTLSLSKGGEGNNETRLRHLLSYSEEPHRFTEAEVIKLISAIDRCKILDPAGGSGAFPMGMLHKLVHILSKLDPDNARWEQRQLDKVDKLIEDAEGIPDANVREKVIEDLQRNRQDIEDSFANNELDYGRKLYLIENCIYGVDIQPIAVQIAKLRFFISLIVEQKTNPEKENLGIRPLPNLETKFVAANTLIGVDRPAQLMLRNPQIDKVEEELRQVREKHFAARTPATKEKYRKKDAELRQALTQLLEKDGWPVAEARKIASWDPYNQNSSSPWFDPEWMFGIKDGFDIVIGNPPYVRADAGEEHLALRKRIIESKRYETLWEKWDLFIPFIELGYKFLKPNGVTTMIVSDAYCHSKYALKSQEWFLRNSRILRLDFLSKIKVFDAGVHNIVYFFQKADGTRYTPVRRVHCETFSNTTTLPSDEQAKLTYRAFFPEGAAAQTFSCKTLKIEEICYISKGMVVNADEKEAKGAFELRDLLSNIKDATHPKSFVEGKDVAKWRPTTTKWLEWGTHRAPHLFSRKTFPELYEQAEKLLLVKVGEVRVAYDDAYLYTNEGIYVGVLWYALAGVRNKSLKNAARYRGENPPRTDLPKREELEATSRRFAVKYLLGVMNSAAARDFLRANRRNNVQLYPDDWKKLPIPDVPMDKQAPIAALVDQILAAKQKHNDNGNRRDAKSCVSTNSDVDTDTLEKQIDEMVYALYDLTPEEIAVVEGKQ